VHVHNVGFEELALTYEFPTGEVPFPAPPKSMPAFLGFPREDGRVGTRNYIAVVAASNCAAHTAEWIASSFEGRNPAAQCRWNRRVPPRRRLRNGLRPGYGSTSPHARRGCSIIPMFSAAIILGLGCEVNQIDHYLGPNAPRTNRLIGMTLQGMGGTRATVEIARKEIRKLMERAAEEKRMEVPASKIVLGLNCGGSDSFSGITANPALGFTSDMLAEIGATAVLARDHRNHRRRTPAGEARAQPRGRRAAAALHRCVQEVSAPVRRKFRRQSIAR